MPVKFEISLQHLCIIAVADSLWNKKEITNKIKMYFCSPTKYLKRDEWNWITKDIIDGIDPQSLPEILYTELLHAVDSLGKKQRDWFRCCRMRNIFRDVPKEQLYEHYFKRIYWTYSGTVDEEKIVSSWFYNPNCDLWKVYVMACCFCSEKVIKEIWMEATKTYKAEDFENLYKNYGWHLGAYWNRFFSNNLSDFIQDIKSNFWNPDFYDESKSVEENMFRLSVAKGYKQAAKKFWLELSEKDKAKIIVESMNAAVNHNANRSRRIAKYYRQDVSIEIFLFLLNYFNDFEQRQLIENKDEFRLIETLPHITRWPWVKLIIPFVINTKGFLDDNGYQKLFEEITARENLGWVHTCKDNIYQRKLLQLWKVLSQENKKKMSQSLTPRLFDLWDVVSLKKILNDPDLYGIKDEVIDTGYQKFETFVRKGNQKMITKFINLIIPIKLEKGIHEKMEMIYKHLLNCEFDLADELLNSFCRSDQEINGFKNEIDNHIVCRYFIIKKQLDFADQFLTWKFNSKDLVNSFKLSYFYNDFSVRYILSLWDTKKENVAEAKLQSGNFLQWFLGSEELITFFFLKKRFSLDSKKLKNAAYAIPAHYETVDDLLNWCFMSEEEKFYYKERCFFMHEMLFCRIACLIGREEWDVAQALLDWKYGFDDFMKDDFMKKFLASDRWSYEIKSFIAIRCGSTMFAPKRPQEEISIKMKKFIKNWMKLVKKYKFNDFERVLEEWPEVSFEMVTQREKRLKENSDSSDESDAECEDDCDHRYIHCEGENLKMFMDLLNSYKESDSELSC